MARDFEDTIDGVLDIACECNCCFDREALVNFGSRSIRDDVLRSLGTLDCGFELKLDTDPALWRCDWYIGDIVCPCFGLCKLVQAEETLGQYRGV